MTDSPRRSGKTTAALLAAPRDATYVVSTHNAIAYTRQLAWRLDRYDLKIVGPSFLQREQFYGHERGKVLADHAVPSHLSDLLDAWARS
jgi:hypothetical protein